MDISFDRGLGVTSGTLPGRFSSSNEPLGGMRRTRSTGKPTFRPSIGPTSQLAGVTRPRQLMRQVSFSLPYSEDIPPMKEGEVADMRWVGFITVADQQGGQYRPRSSSPATYGGFSDIWQCDASFLDGSSVVVAVKKLRAVKIPRELNESETSRKLLKRLKTELTIWMRLQHPNIAPLLGFTFHEEIAIISPWFSRGNLSDYLAKRPETNRMSLIEGVATGLAYLHFSTPPIIHGDIKPDNVLIDQKECPRITDFGLSKIVEEEDALSSLRSASLRDAGNTRWIAPELLLEEGVSRSKKTDIFSFGSVTFFIFTGDVPFKGIADGQLVISRYKGADPIQDGSHYPNLSADMALMSIMRSCWDKDPQCRPEIGDVVTSLAREPSQDRPKPNETPEHTQQSSVPHGQSLIIDPSTSETSPHQSMPNTSKETSFSNSTHTTPSETKFKSDNDPILDVYTSLEQGNSQSSLVGDASNGTTDSTLAMSYQSLPIANQLTRPMSLCQSMRSISGSTAFSSLTPTIPEETDVVSDGDTMLDVSVPIRKIMPKPGSVSIASTHLASLHQSTPSTSDSPSLHPPIQTPSKDCEPSEKHPALFTPTASSSSIQYRCTFPNCSWKRAVSKGCTRQMCPGHCRLALQENGERCSKHPQQAKRHLDPEISSPSKRCRVSPRKAQPLKDDSSRRDETSV